MTHTDVLVRGWLAKQRDELVNMTRTNKLLHFKHTKTASLEIESPDAVRILERLNGGGAGAGWRFHAPPDEAQAEGDGAGRAADIRSATGSRLEPGPDELAVAGKDADQLEKSLRLLERKANQEFVDKGLWVLYLGLGMLEWRETETENRPSAGPIYLLPVTIARDSLREPFRLRRTEEDPVVNPALAIKLESEFDISLPNADEFEAAGFDGALRDVESLVSGQRGWSVSRRVVLSTFTFQKEAMYRDLDDHAEHIVEHPMVQLLSLGADAPSAGGFGFEPVPQDRLDSDPPPEELASVLDSDASQRSAILAARAGRSFVMDGPPGTGKSQTITNIIAELLYAGNSVLFVSEKAAALDVVHDRLKDARLDEFVLQLHSHNATRKAVASELGSALSQRPVAKGSLQESERAELVRRREALSAYAQAMNETRWPLGLSLHHVLGMIAARESAPQAPVPDGFDRSLRPEAFEAVRDSASALAGAWAPVQRGDGFLWRDLDDPTVSARRRSEVERDLGNAGDALASLRSVADAVEEELGLGSAAGPRDARRLAKVLTLLDERVEVPLLWLTAESLAEPRVRMERLAELTADHRTVCDRLAEHAGIHAHGLSPRHAAGLRDALATLASASPPLEVDGAATAERAVEVSDFLRGGAKRLAAVAEDAGRVAAGFGLVEHGITVARAAQLAELGGLMDSPNRPEAHWLDPTRQAELDQAERTLGERVGEFRARRSDLARVFTDQVLELDLKAMHVRFTEQHRGLRKLRGAYRQDKRALAACTVGGRVGPAVLERLPEAVAWQEAEARLSAAETHYAHVLGGHYYSREGADFARIAEAAEVARRAVELSGGAGVRALAPHLARGSAPDPSLLQVAHRLRSAVAGWLDEMPRFTGSGVDDLRRIPIADAERWCTAAAQAVSAVADGVRHVGSVTGRPATVSFARTALEHAERAERLRAEADERFSEDSRLLGDRLRGVDTDWTALGHALSWAEGLRAALAGPVHPRTAEALAATGLSSADLLDRLATWDKAVSRITGHFTGPYREHIGAVLDDVFEGAEHLIRELRDSTGDIDVWAAYTSARADLGRRGLEPVVAFCAEQRLESEQIPAVVERAVMEAWADDVLEVDADRLSALRADERDTIAERFRELDRRLVESAAARVINACTDRRPTTNAGPAGTIQRESQKKRRHMPIRDLLGKAGEVAQQLKPCFMMSPLSVSQYLPADLGFDVVIFDEASQVRPSDAVNCVYRGKRLIVAGDQKQLPPTSFFAAIGDADDDTYDEEQIDDFESVLDLCKAAGALRSLPLRWHYRSRHESLITYSNYRFYGGGLFTFPGAVEEATDLGVELIKVNGVYRRGGARDNPVEARKVVDRVLHHRRSHPELTLGVVAFSTAQETAIEAELEARAAEYPELDGLRTDDRIGGFFVKSLENVQGDERDIILFCVGYGPDETGRFRMQIPHLNRQGGERRLNVAITRAKRRVEIVTSVLAGDFHPPPRSEGLRCLQGYLDYAERGMPALAADFEADDSAAEPESPFEEEVLRCIRAWGYQAQPQVGAAGYRIDIGVRHPLRPGSYALAVECDGAMYHSSKVARDRDRLRQGVLEGLGWRIHRIWGTAWYRRRAEQEERLRRAIEDAVEGGGNTQDRGRPAASAVAPEPADPSVRVWQHEADLDDDPDWAAPYRPARLEAPRTVCGMHEPEARPELAAMIGYVVRQEGPVHRDRVLRAVREAWGWGRAGSRIQEGFGRAVESLVRLGQVRREDDCFLVADSAVLRKVRIPTDDKETQRKAEHVPGVELRMAVAGIVHDARSIAAEELSQRVARLFGWGRRGTNVQAAIDDAVGALLESGELVKAGDLLRPAPAGR